VHQTAEHRHDDDDSDQECPDEDFHGQNLPR
jgi:hypothetical protein